MTEPERVASRRRDRGAGVAFVVLIVELVLVAGVYLLQVPIASALMVHGLVVVALGLRCRSIVRRGNDAGTPALLAIAVAVAGPFGALGGIVIDWLSTQGQEHRDRLARWYDRISLSIDTDDVTKISDHIVIGRGMDLGGPAPEPFKRLLEHGTVTEKQAVLGLVARRFHPHYLSALQTALVSDEPVIRVQAAAVAARVRGDLATEVERMLTEVADVRSPGDRLRLSEEIERCVASGLLEERQSELAAAAVNQARAGALSQLATAARPALAGRSVAAANSLSDRAARTAFEDSLLAEGRYAEFRRLRRAFAVPVKGRMRLRLGRWPAMRKRRGAAVTGGASRS